MFDALIMNCVSQVSK